jgi:hypothetical protein
MTALDWLLVGIIAMSVIGGLLAALCLVEKNDSGEGFHG